MMFRNTLSLLLALPFVSAHRSLPQGITCSSQFYSPETALTVPNSKISWASYRIFTCDEPVFWLEADADAGQTLHFTSTVPEIERFRDVRITAALIGPGLPALTNTTSNVPDEIVAYAQDNGHGMAIFKSPENQSTCDHLMSEPMNKESKVVDGRCHFYEPFGGSNSWVVLDENIVVDQAGSYKFAVYVEGGTTAKASFACCDWPEDFLTEYPITETDCPFCGTNPDENPASGSFFYEQKSMEQYGGFPPLQSCSAPGSGDLQPITEEQCPPPPGSDVVNQPDSCNLGCSSDGECHSHNALGGCVHALEWDLQPKFGNAPVSKVTIFKGDTIQFGYTGTSGNVHNVFEMSDSDSLDQCDFTDATAVANVEEVKVGYNVEFDQAGEYYFSCGISCTGFPEEKAAATRQQEDEMPFDSSLCHCRIGQKLTVEVKDATEGLRCHDHAPFTTQQAAVEPLSCPDGQVVASTVDNALFGAMDDTQCAEFCIQAFVLQFMENVEMGGCLDKGFMYDPKTMDVKVPGSPQDITVRIMSSNEPSTCHCHSYEEIVCPEDETPEDTLYAEHITEIEEYCTGILDGTEQDCPYKCFQPMEVLHLHYLECPTRLVDPTYLAVNATEKCHIAATAPDDAECPVVNPGGSDSTVGSTSGALFQQLCGLTGLALSLAFFVM